MAAWFSYYTNSTLKSKRIKGFATLPCRQSKHTAAKAPMAHKTYSQEQFIIKYYFLVFKTNTNEISKSSFSSIDKSLLIANIFSNISSFSGTNMLILYKVKLWYDSTDCSFFSYRIN